MDHQKCLAGRLPPLSSVAGTGDTQNVFYSTVRVGHTWDRRIVRAIRAWCVYNGGLKNTINRIPTCAAAQQYTWFTLKIVFIPMTMTTAIRAKNLPTYVGGGSARSVTGTLIFQSVRYRRLRYRWEGGGKETAADTPSETLDGSSNCAASDA